LNSYSLGKGQDQKFGNVQINEIENSKSNNWLDLSLQNLQMVLIVYWILLLKLDFIGINLHYIILNFIHWVDLEVESSSNNTRKCTNSLLIKFPISHFPVMATFPIFY